MPRNDRLHWTPFYWADWLCDPGVRLLRHDERGRYIDFLALSYQTDHPGQHTEDGVRSMLGYSVSEWPDHRQNFSRCFLISGRLWTQKRARQEAERAERIHQKLSESGRKGGLTRAAKSTTYQAPLKPPLSPAQAYTHTHTQKDSLLGRNGHPSNCTCEQCWRLR